MECQYCGEEFSMMEYLPQHIVSVHPGQILDLNVKGSAVGNMKHGSEKVDMSEKIEIWVNACEEKVVKVHNCNKCTEQFQTRKKLSNHTFRSHSEPVSCTECQKWVKNKKQLSSHVKTVHVAINYFCNKCGKGLKSLRKFKSHENMCGKFRRNKGNIPCTVCHKCYSSQHNLIAHVRKAHNEASSQSTFILDQPVRKKKSNQDIDCLICQKTFRKRIYLNHHMKKKHEAEHIEDDIFVIKKIQNTKGILERMTVNLSPDSVPWLLCSKCPHRFKTHKSLFKHKAEDHKGLKPFTCSFCPASFETNSHMKSHKASVHIQKRFDCELCNKKFKLKKHLVAHVRRHSNPFGQES